MSRRRSGSFVVFPSVVLPSVVLTVATICAGGLACKGSDTPAAASGKPGRKPLKFPVQIEPVAARTVEYAVNAVGSVEAFETVHVTARVQGVVDKVRFVEGQRTGLTQVLVEIEPARYKLTADAMGAALGKARASHAEAEASLKRRESAVVGSPGLIPDEEIATWRTRVLTAAAEVSAAEAAKAQADLNLRDAFVRAPLAGVIETRKVETGQYVQAGTVLATLVRREPMLIRFGVPAGEAAELRAGLPARFRIRGDSKERQARLNHVAQSADPSSRLVTVTAQVLDATDDSLRPGAFAQITVPVGSARDVPVLSETSVRPTERGFVAFVTEGGVAHERVLTLGLRTTDGRIEVKGGIKVGELVVVHGAEALRDGSQIAIEGGGPPGGRPGGGGPGPGKPRGDGGLHP